jgi:riboflavin-specific deaminase-like protein
MVRGTPWVRLKVAASLDGTTALHNGASQWITSPAARADGHAWRARACAVLTGIGTVLADNPRLDVRSVTTPRQPQAVVLDSHLQTNPDAHLFIASRAFTIYAAGHFDSDFLARKAALEARGATVVQLPGTDGRVDLPALLRDLGARGINELHVEAGHRLNGALLQAGLVDELLLYLAPQLLGPGAAWPTWCRSIRWPRGLHWISTPLTGWDPTCAYSPASRAATSFDTSGLRKKRPQTLPQFTPCLLESSPAWGRSPPCTPWATRLHMASAWSLLRLRAIWTMLAWATALR